MSVNGDKIREAREAAKMSQAALAALVGVVERTIIRWEGGETKPSAAMVKECLAILSGCHDKSVPNDDTPLALLTAAIKKAGLEGRVDPYELNKVMGELGAPKKKDDKDEDDAKVKGGETKRLPPGFARASDGSVVYCGPPQEREAGALGEPQGQRLAEGE